ncbi:L-glyceraldehyde 3-phosphate reductase [Nonomuraea sp. KC401]|uniref:L-glyceraldehyde 3-phosphate reductase n=1 Tax=Nonomuraea longispora TaxID=1848320 RepID=A0A4R4NBG6_9ACTN|nr:MULTISPECIES: aldo/keto reductase [Nonomuraea]NBE98471.1 L-glyceraldehyde 3-phosphate reductase [Nonomuraea sp. K271]TDC04377.1 L-glyceraldehyde 3-phosphate reductase [Nonomuraea longispora]TLF60950.1 L-glyceraldehyde 3-phosphate reductase [Nonomuraea sp. KC401]
MDYERQPYRRCGRSGLLLPAVSLGLWHNFGGGKPLDSQRTILHKALDLGITHFDIADRYGPPLGAAESTFGRIFPRSLRDEVVVTTKGSNPMWDGPYGMGNSRKHLLATLDRSLERLGLDFVDIFYLHRDDPGTPLEEQMATLDHMVRTGRVLYVGVSNFSPERTAQAARLLRELGTPLLVHQPSYSLLNRGIEDSLLGVLEEQGVGCVVYSPLAQGLLTDRYLDGIPADSRAAEGRFLTADRVTPEVLTFVRSLSALAEARGQTVAQLSLAWALRDPRITSVLVGASSPEQLEANVAAVDNLGFTHEELAAIERAAKESGVAA